MDRPATPAFDMFFSQNDGSTFKERMCAYIAEEFAEELGADVALLSTAGGLDILGEKLKASGTVQPASRDALLDQHAIKPGDDMAEFMDVDRTETGFVVDSGDPSTNSDWRVRG